MEKVTFNIPKDTLYQIHNYVYDTYKNNEIVCNMFFTVKDNVLQLHIDKHSLSVGGDDNVSSNNNSVYIDMHTHPVKAYTQYNTYIGYPSTDDFYTILQSSVEDKSLFHVLGSMEGLYIISLHKDILDELHELWDSSTQYEQTQLLNVLKQYIDQHVTYTKQNFENGQYIKGHYINSGETYQDFINNICSRDKQCIQLGNENMNLFHIQFIPWVNTNKYKMLSDKTNFYKHLTNKNFNDVQTSIYVRY